MRELYQSGFERAWVIPVRSPSCISIRWSNGSSTVTLVQATRYIRLELPKSRRDSELMHGSLETYYEVQMICLRNRLESIRRKSNNCVSLLSHRSGIKCNHSRISNGKQVIVTGMILFSVFKVILRL